MIRSMTAYARRETKGEWGQRGMGASLREPTLP